MSAVIVVALVGLVCSYILKSWQPQTMQCPTICG